eukprot:TRINITY_DN0_c2821_g1_i2.p1 TRINITY_DN0_c2821_g1~~TRINITY_DN0_c2821_g1_i2.p1  ORF type:complete len:134 (+),score=27.35 TRINITY_DN0_c2821_g1_i2:1-402(+)
MCIRDRERLIGFFICFIVSFFLCWVSLRTLKSDVEGIPYRFVYSYTIGCILQFIGTSFLCGIIKQCLNLTEPKRLFTAIVHSSAIIFAFLSILYLRNGILGFFFVLAQVSAYTWYVVTYIPYIPEVAQRVIKV